MAKPTFDEATTRVRPTMMIVVAFAVLCAIAVINARGLAFELAAERVAALSFDRVQVRLVPGRPTTVLPGGTGKWHFDVESGAAVTDGAPRREGASRPALTLNVDPRDSNVLQWIERTSEIGPDGITPREVVREVARIVLTDDGISLYADLSVVPGAVQIEDLGQVGLRDRDSNRRITLLITPRPTTPLSAVFILDASGSMAGPRLDAARRALLDTLGELPPRSEASLFVFDDCARVTHTVPFVTDHDVVRRAVAQVQAKGGTPLGDAIAQGRAYLETAGRFPLADRLLFVLTDGFQTCGIDPKDALKDFNDDDKGPRLVIVAFDMPSQQVRVLEELAESVGGTVEARNPTQERRERPPPMRRK